MSLTEQCLKLFVPIYLNFVQRYSTVFTHYTVEEVGRGWHGGRELCTRRRVTNTPCARQSSLGTAQTRHANTPPCCWTGTCSRTRPHTPLKHHQHFFKARHRLHILLKQTYIISKNFYYITDLRLFKITNNSMFSICS